MALIGSIFFGEKVLQMLGVAAMHPVHLWYMGNIAGNRFGWAMGVSTEWVV